MAEYKAPGMFVEETSFRSKTITGIHSDVAAFVGPTLAGPIGAEPPPLASFAEFQTHYGGFSELPFSGGSDVRRNHVALAVQAYFDNGGRRLHVARTPCSCAGQPPTPADYASALATLAGLPEVSTVAAPGHGARWSNDLQAWAAIRDHLLAFAQAPGNYRLAVLESPPSISLSGLRELRGGMDCSHAALYHPWVIVANPLVTTGIDQPATVITSPLGFVCGSYAHTSLNRGPSKGLLNITLVGVQGFDQPIDAPTQETLNPLGINCLRTFTGHESRIWGDRTLSSDSEWQYVTVRRYANYLERSIDQGTQWVVFEPNGAALWATLRQTIEDFLFNEWKDGALLGTKPEEAYFVRCDTSTTSQADIQAGRLTALIGFAPLKPAEFVIFRVGKKTADAPG